MLRFDPNSNSNFTPQPERKFMLIEKILFDAFFNVIIVTRLDQTIHRPNRDRRSFLRVSFFFTCPRCSIMQTRHSSVIESIRFLKNFFYKLPRCSAKWKYVYVSHSVDLIQGSDISRKLQVEFYFLPRCEMRFSSIWYVAASLIFVSTTLSDDRTWTSQICRYKSWKQIFVAIMVFFRFCWLDVELVGH